jgi:hypothetical protein
MVTTTVCNVRASFDGFPLGYELFTGNVHEQYLVLRRERLPTAL